MKIKSITPPKKHKLKSKQLFKPMPLLCGLLILGGGGSLLLLYFPAFCRMKASFFLRLFGNYISFVVCVYFYICVCTYKHIYT